MSSDDSHCFTLDPDFKRVLELVRIYEGTLTTSDGRNIPTGDVDPPPFPWPVSVSLCHVLWTLCGNVTTLPRYDLSEQASILTDRTDNRRMPGGVREAMCHGD